MGFWTAVLVTILAVWFTAAFAPYMANLKWDGVEEFAAVFQSGPYLVWVIPCLFLALTYPILAGALYFGAKEGGRFFSFIGLMFGIMYGAILSTNYWLLATVVRGAIINGNTDGLSWLIIGSPFSITNAIEGIGYGFMGLSTLFIGLGFGGPGLPGWIKKIWVVNELAVS